MQAKTTPVSRRRPLGNGVYRRPDGSYEIGWRDSTGKQRWKSPFRTKREAQAARGEEVARRARGEKVATDPRLSFNAAADAWVDARVSRLKPNTRSAYDAGLKHLRPVFGRRRVMDITAGDLGNYISAKQAEGLKAWTVKGHLTVLSGVYNHAARHLGYPGTNPVSLLDRMERPNSDEDEKPKRILSATEQARLLSVVEQRYHLLFLMASRTGLRLGEVLGLIWDEVEVHDVPQSGGAVHTVGTIHVSHQLDRKTRTRVPLKTARSRRVLDLDPDTARALMAGRGDAPGHAYVFTTRTGLPHDHRNIGGRVLARAVKNADLGDVEAGGVVVTYAPTFHSLRHTHASQMIASGFDVETVSQRLGHANAAITQRIYVHQFDAAGRRDEHRARLAGMYGSSLEAFVEAPGGPRVHQTEA